MNKFKKISTDKFELKGKQTIISTDKAQNIIGGRLTVGTDDICM